MNKINRQILCILLDYRYIFTLSLYCGEVFNFAFSSTDRSNPLHSSVGRFQKRTSPRFVLITALLPHNEVPFHAGVAPTSCLTNRRISITAKNRRPYIICPYVCSYYNSRLYTPTGNINSTITLYLWHQDISTSAGKAFTSLEILLEGHQESSTWSCLAEFRFSGL